MHNYSSDGWQPFPSEHSFEAKLKTMKKMTLLLLVSVGLSPVLFSSCSSVGSTAGNGTGSSYVKATDGSNGVQWSGGNDVAD